MFLNHHILNEIRLKSKSDMMKRFLQYAAHQTIPALLMSAKKPVYKTSTYALARTHTHTHTHTCTYSMGMLTCGETEGLQL